MSPAPATALPPWRIALVAALPVALCLLVMAVPAIGHGHALAYRIVYLLANAGWVPVLAWLQRRLWRRGVSAWRSVPVLLAATYLMSAFNNGLGFALAAALHWDAAPLRHWQQLFTGLDGCWLALVAFCATHALVAHEHALKEQQRRQREAELAARQAELRALRCQLQPHFLFNTLNGISALVGEGRGAQARQTIAWLGELLRAMLETQAHEVTLAEELALTETYLAIEQVRLGDRLQLEWRIGAEVLEARVPPLLLQPLVENAIRHGIAPRRAPGRLEIQAERDPAGLRLRVRNDMPPAGGELHAGTGTGQANVAARLAWLYPGQAAFAAGPDAQGRYCVEVRLPHRERPEAA